MKTYIYTQILEAVEKATEIPRERILSREKQPDVVEARSLLFYFLYKKGFRRSEIARLTKLSRQCVASHITTFDDRRGVEGSIMSIFCKDIGNILSASCQ